MTRDELIDLLSRLVFDGVITEDDAVAILAQFDRGELPEDWQLPLAPVDVLAYGEDSRLVIAISAASGILAQVQTPIPEPDILQDMFDDTVTQIVQQLFSGALSLGAWQGSMAQTIVQNMILQSLAGSRGLGLPASAQQALQTSILTQLAFLSRFADQIAPGGYSLAYVTNRALSYGGIGRAVFYAAREEADYGQASGYVVDYIARDDGATCSRCSDASRGGPYLPGSGPMPGEVCLGRNSCRCRREVRYDPSAYARLVP